MKSYKSFVKTLLTDDRTIHAAGEINPPIPIFRLNIPNILTILRLLLILVVVYWFAKEKVLLALIFYCLAGISDVLDGMVARKLGQITIFGKLVDPVADKAMLLTVMICMFIYGMLSLPLLLLIALKEGLMVAGGLYLYFKRGRVVSSNKFGKFSAMLFFIAILLQFFHSYVEPFSSLFMYCAVSLSLISLVQYFYLNMYLPGKESKSLGNG